MISFIIPYLDSRKDLFEINKKSLEQQTDKDFEIITVPVTGTNPAEAQNIGARQAGGNILVLTSPEVINAITNVEEMKKLPTKTFWIGHVVEEKKENVPFDFSRDSLMSVIGIQNGIAARCTKSDWEVWKYFLGVIHKEDYFSIGGIDEDYMKGIAWEDRDFADRITRSDVKPEFNNKIVGVHLRHSRSYQDNSPELRKINKESYWRKTSERSLIYGC